MSWRIGILWGALAVVGCGKQQVATTAPTITPGQHDHSPGVDEPDDDRVAIEGQLRAHDGSALRMAEVTIRRSGFREPIVTAELDADGRFHVDVPPGLYMVAFAAVDHCNTRRSTLVTDDLRVGGQLGTCSRTAPKETVGIRAEFLDAAGKPIGDGPKAAKRVDAQVYRLDFGTKPEAATKLRYQLAEGGGHTYNGPVADAYASDGGGDFWSIVDLANGRDGLDLDLSALPPAGEAPDLEWTGEDASSAALNAFDERWNPELWKIRDRMPRTDGKIFTMTDELRAETEALAVRARADVDAASDPTTHALLRGAHAGMFTGSASAPQEKQAQHDEVVWIIDNLSPVDPRLGMLPNLDNRIFVVLEHADEELARRIRAWLERRARDNPEPGSAFLALNTLIHQADAEDDTERVAELYALVVDERFDGMSLQTYLKQRYDPDRPIQRGKPFPAFDFAALGDDAARITSADRTDRVYLLEFWATWCGPCVQEMPKLHEAYATINAAKRGKGRGDAGLRKLKAAKQPKVEFVFVSLDIDPTHVEAFRRKHWSMPWTHAFVGREGEREVMKRYGFSGVPTMVLLDGDGTILEVEENLRGDQLVPTLQRVLAERSATQTPTR